MYIRVLVVTLAFALGLLATGCDRPLVVQADPTGAKKLPLNGDKGVVGTVTRTLKAGNATAKKGAEVRVIETWLIRKEAGDPPSYRISGRYDPAQRTDGFVLPARAVDVYFVSTVGPAHRARVAVPKAYFEEKKK